MQPAPFLPPRWLRGPHAQSILPSLPLRRMRIARRTAEWRSRSRELLLDCGDGVTLQAFHNDALQASRAPAPLAVLLHGWEGSAESQYILSLADALLRHGVDVVRLNLRDHGDTHHLNQELFHSCRLPEVVGAVQRLQSMFAAQPLLLAGFSLGGNFMLRIAAEAPRAALRIEHVLAVSPLLDPDRTLDALENGMALYHTYFVRKWTRSLLRKQRAWPGVYRFEALLRSRNLRRMTEELVLAHTEYPDLQTYLAGYAITGERLADLQVRSTILTSTDDPMIPAADLARLARSPALRIVTTPHGGHCGFLRDLGPATWVDEFALRELAAVGLLSLPAAATPAAR